MKIIGILFLFISFIAGVFLHLDDKPFVESQTERSISSEMSYYEEKVQPIFDNRCVVCHSCYNAPCQLNLGSHEGVLRGAKDDDIYNFGVVTNKKPTRLFIDGTSPEEWKQKHNFFKVVEGLDNKEEYAKGLLYRMIANKKGNKAVGEFDSVGERSCPNANKLSPPTSNGTARKPTDQFPKLLKDRPWSMMPYGFPELTNEEFGIIAQWLSDGAPGPIVPYQIRMTQPSDVVKGPVILDKWEEFLNQEDMKSRISARYIYEHLAFGHIYFKSLSGDFFRLVRASSRTGEINEFMKTRPYNEIKEKFYYRFAKIVSTIVHKTHITYELSDEKLERYKELFINTDWGDQALEFPSYKKKTASNPFITFKDIPAKSRYKFLLDNAYYHIMTFIRGPVCKGPTALNVIDDHFWVMFMDPDSDPASLNPDYLKEAMGYLTPPASHGSKPKVYTGIRKKQMKYRELSSEFYKKQFPKGIQIDDIWDGEGTNDNALLTVFRHHDSSTVKKGAIGEMPKTLWILDYPILEDIYYNLVAGYNVYGAVIHQVNTRRYMEYSRVNAQDNFISMLPKEKRVAIRNSWSTQEGVDVNAVHNSPLYRLIPGLYKGDNPQRKMAYSFPFFYEDTPTSVSFETEDPQKELIEKIFSTRLKAFTENRKDELNVNRLGANFQISSEIKTTEEFKVQARKVFGQKGNYANAFPEVALLRLKNENASDSFYTIVHNREHWNVSFMFSEEARYRPDMDSLNLYPFQVGSYPNYFFVVDIKDSSDFLKQVKDMKPEVFQEFVDEYGVNRMQPDFWSHFDWFQKHLIDSQPIEGGVIDLNRYKNY